MATFYKKWWFWLIVVIVVIASYFTFSTPKLIPADSLTYRNEKFGFELTFNEAWEDYWISRPGHQFLPVEGSVLFQVRDDFASKIIPNCRHACNKGVFTIRVFTLKNWEDTVSSGKKEEFKLEYLTENERYVIAYATEGESQNRWGQDFRLDEVLSSIKIIEQ